MGLVLFIGWWYSTGWKNAFTNINKNTRRVMQELSLGIIVRTLFEPWKQITMYAGPGAPIDVKLHVLFDNVFARVFGFVIRIGLIFVGLAVSAVAIVVSTAIALVWPIVPTLPVLFIVLAVV